MHTILRSNIIRSTGFLNNPGQMVTFNSNYFEAAQAMSPKPWAMGT